MLQQFFLLCFQCNAKFLDHLGDIIIGLYFPYMWKVYLLFTKHSKMFFFSRMWPGNLLNTAIFFFKDVARKLTKCDQVTNTIVGRDYNIVSDPWMIRQHPSISHLSSSNWDKVILVSRPLLVHLRQAVIHPIVISDHAPVSLMVSSGYFNNTQPLWNFPLPLYNEEIFAEYLQNWWLDFKFHNAPRLMTWFFTER